MGNNARLVERYACARSREEGGGGGDKEEIRGEEGKRCGATTSEFSVG